MPRGREPDGRVASPARSRSQASTAGRWACGFAVVLAAACSGRGEGASGGMSRQGGGLISPFSEGIGHVGNEVRGIEAMPDYDAEAQRLRKRVEPYLPRPLPGPQLACTSMLDGAREYYAGVDGEGSTAVAKLAATREADMDTCVEETSPAAAACVAVMIAHNEGEYPWLLDQCSRAFPRAEG